MTAAAKKPIVHVVHCIDTEGPLDETIEATFERLRTVFGIALEPTPGNLKRLQGGEIDLGGQTAAVKRMLDPNLLGYKRNWGEIDRMLEQITARPFRMALPDSAGNGWQYNWFCVDHVGYLENPRRRSLGHHLVFDHYQQLCQREGNRQDRIFFHYHPLPHNRRANASATSYLNNNHLFEILARKVIERRWFPTVFRPGFHVTRPDSHWFLEQWIPFDYANQASDTVDDQPDISGGRFGDWRRGPKVWGAYHPNHDDYQIEGCCRRWIFRCLNMEARQNALTRKDVDAAFIQAQETGSAVLAFANHDFRDMASEIDKVRGLIANSAARYPGVDFCYTDAIEAARSHLGLNDVPPLGMELEVSFRDAESLVLHISSAEPLFGPQPFLAIKDRQGNFWHDNFDFTLNPQHWSYTFDWQTCPPEALSMSGIAGVGAAGQAEIILFDPASGSVEKTLLNGVGA